MKVNISVFGLHVSVNLGLGVQTDLSRRAEELQEEIEYLPVEHLLKVAASFRASHKDILADHALDPYWLGATRVDQRGEQFNELLELLEDAAREAAPSIRAAAPLSMERPAHPDTPAGWRTVGRYCGR